MHFFKYFLVTVMITLSTLFFVACEGGEANYSLEEVQSHRFVDDLIQGTITFITEDSIFVDQNSNVVTTVKADTNENILYSIVGGADKELFTIDEQTGEVMFISTPVYNSLFSNVYEVIVGVTTTSGELSILSIFVTVAEDINAVEPIIDFAVTKVDAVSSTAVITQIQARPANPTDDLRFTVKGTDAASFSIDNDGNLVFIQPLPDYGTTPGKEYNIYIEVIDGHQNITLTDNIIITLVGNRDEIRPVVESSTFTVPENALGNLQLQVTTLGTGNIIKYVLSGNDAPEFSVDTSGVLAFNVAKDFEFLNNIYHINVQVEDDKGNMSDIKAVVVNVANIDEQYDFQSIADVTVLSGTKVVTQVTAVSRVLTNVTRKYSLNNHTDIFEIDGGGNIQFKSVATIGGSYAVEVLVASYVTGTEKLINGSQTVSPVFNVSVVANPALIAPTITSSYVTTTSVAAPIDVNDVITTIVASIDADSNATTFSYTTRGDNPSSFRVDDLGNLYFQSDVDYINSGNNTYSVIVDITDNNGNVTSTDTISVTVLQDPTTYIPTISKTTYQSPENTLGSIMLEADARGNGNIASFSIVGGEDEGAFNLVGTVLSFKQAPDYETKTTYRVQVRAMNDTGYESVAADLVISIENIDETLIFTSLDHFNYTSGSVFSKFITVSPTAGLTLEFVVVSGGDRFSIDASTGKLIFKTVPIYQLNGTNSYTVEINASSQYNGSMTKSSPITVDILPASRAISFQVSSVDTSIFDAQGEAHLEQSEDTTIQITATSAVDGAQIHYSIEGDNSIFAIDESSGAMVISAPAYIYSDLTEINTYRATVVATADDGFNTVDRLPGIMHVNAIDGTPTFSTSSSFAVNENIKSIATVHADLPAVVGSTLKYSIVGGADSALFKIDETSGALLFWNAQNFENPVDANGDNVYEVRVAVKDIDPLNILNVATQNITVSVNNVADAPTNITFVGGSTSTTASDGYRTWFFVKWKYYTTTSYRQIVATSSPSNGTLTYSIKTNPNSGIFSISATGELRVDAPRYSGDEIFDLEIQVNEDKGESSTTWLRVVILDD